MRTFGFYPSDQKGKAVKLNQLFKCDGPIKEAECEDIQLHNG